MSGFRRCSTVALVAALTLAVACGDEDAPTPPGGSAGKGSSGHPGAGTGGSAPGAGGEAGSSENGNGATSGANPSNGGEAGSDGTSGSAAGGSTSGAGGESGEMRLELTSGDAVSDQIGPEGGSLELPGVFSLEIPADALSEPTELTLTALLLDEQLFAISLEPSGLVFEKPAVGRVPFADGDGVDGETLIAPLLFDDGAPPEAAGNAALELGDAGPIAVRFDVPHFSVLSAWLVSDSANGIVGFSPLTRPTPWSMPVSVPFTNPTEATLAVDVVERNVCVGVTKATCGNLAATFTAKEADVGFALFYPEPPVQLLGGPLTEDRVFPVRKGQPAYLSRSWICKAAGTGGFGVKASFGVTGTLRIPNVSFITDAERGNARSDFQIVLRPGSSATIEQRLFGESERLDYKPVECNNEPSLLAALKLDDDRRTALANRVKTAWRGECVELSNKKQCLPPIPALAIGNTLDPVLELGPNAVDRLEAAFPCGEGPVGLTLCASANAFSEGDWVYVAAATLEDLILDDETGIYQLAFVFDADGDPDNNYVPSADYPGDFFSGTDKWYEATYTPGGGWHLRVRDVRQGLADVASDARFVLVGRELGLFLPRAELDGDVPGFRVTAFRHEGDYGLSGGPWSASYYPYLDQPLLPAASGASIVVPE